MTNCENSNREKYDYNEYLFYAFMPNSNVQKTDYGYFLRNDAIETYSYITPTEMGSIEFSIFLRQSFSFFDDGKKYFIIKLPYDLNYNKNSKILREKGFLKFFTDVNVMALSKFDKVMKYQNNALEIDELEEKNYDRWITVFFDAFQYPRNLKSYIKEMVLQQMKNGVHFFVGKVSGKDVTCFCSMEKNKLIGIYGVGTKKKFQRRGYAKAMLSNYIAERAGENEEIEFCLQTILNSGAEKLYKKLGFEQVYVQKRFEWNPN